ncbi:MAG: fibronectin type III domain-containing protein [Bacillota bacterium]
MNNSKKSTFLLIVVLVVMIFTNVPINGETQIAAPIILNFPRVSNSSLEIKWIGVENANKYEIFRSEDKTDYEKVGSSTNNTFVDNSLKPSTSYYYRVKAVNTAKGNESQLSAYMHVSTPESGEVVVSEEVKVFSREQIAQVFIELSGDKVVLKRNPKTDLLRIDDLIFSEEYNSFGFFHQIIDIDINDNEITLHIQELNPVDVLHLFGDAVIAP